MSIFFMVIFCSNTFLEPLPDLLLDLADPLPDPERLEALELALDEAFDPLEPFEEAREARDEAREEAFELALEPWK